MRGGSFAELGGSAQLTAGNGLTGAGEIATGAKLGPLSASASLNVSGGLESPEGLVVTREGMDMNDMYGGGRRKGIKRTSKKRRSSSSRKSLGKFKSMGNVAPLNHSMSKSHTRSSQSGGRRKRRSTKRSSRKHKRSSSTRKHKRSSSTRKHKRSSSKRKY
jgi:hypothetical protein